MTAPLFAVNDYVQALQALMPRGLAWPRDPSSTQAQLLSGLAPSLYRVNGSAIQLLIDAFPATADAMLPEWQETLGLPGLYGYTGSDLATQQAQVVAALTDDGGQSAAYFIALAVSLGLAITINGYRPYTVDDPVDVPIYGAAWAHVWRVSATASGDYSVLKLIFERYKPAHTVIFWDVPIGDLLLESGDHLLIETGEMIAMEY